MRAPKTPTDHLLVELRTAALPGEDRYRAQARRADLLPGLRHIAEDAYLSRQRKARHTRWAALAAGLAAAASYAVYRAVPSPVAPSAAPRNEVLALAGSVEIIHEAHQRAAMAWQAEAVAPTDEVVTAEGARARASLASGAEVEIGPDSRIRLATAPPGSPPSAPSEAVDLAAGRVLVRVPKLGPARSFAVRMADTTVVVHGTVFSVERRPTGEAGMPLTSVEVAEGRVAVQHGGTEIFLRAGEHWSSAPAAESSEPRRAPQASGPEDDSSDQSATGNREPSREEKRSSLGEENRLLKGAMSARQQGKPARALSLIDRLLRRYPSSALAEEARVERMRALLAVEGAAAAAREAQRYLADYPHGFAREEASRLAAGDRP